jgi:hypothetical protein
MGHGAAHSPHEDIVRGLSFGMILKPSVDIVLHGILFFREPIIAVFALISAWCGQRGLGQGSK